MSRQRLDSQPDLFATNAVLDRPEEDEADAVFVDGIRRELLGILDEVTGAPDIPWPDRTRALLTEKRFHSLAASWLPSHESRRLRLAFAAELDRIYGEVLPLRDP